MIKRAGLVCLLLVAACGGDSGGGGDDVDADVGGGPPTLAGTPGTWTWTDVPGTQCMNASATGMGVNLGTNSDLVIYMEGGGACFNAFTCASVAHAQGFKASDLAGAGNVLKIGPFDRTDAANPFKDATYVFLPYCTGDIFAGANPSGFGGRTQVGYSNVGHYLDTIVPASGPVRRVILFGVSAGGFGVLYNFDRVQKAFGEKPVFAVDDSGIALPDSVMTPCLQTQLRTLWSLDSTLPAGCTACKGADGGGLVNLATYLGATYPERRLGLIASTKDGVIRSFFGFGYPNCQSGGQPVPEAAFAAGVTELKAMAPTNFKLFTNDSNRHVWSTDPLETATPNGQNLATWINAMLADDPSWTNVGP